MKQKSKIKARLTHKKTKKKEAPAVVKKRGVLAILGEKKEENPLDMIAATVSAKLAKTGPAKPSTFVGELQELCDKHGYVLNLQSLMNGQRIQATCDFVGKTNLYIPDIEQVKLEE